MCTVYFLTSKPLMQRSTLCKLESKPYRSKKAFELEGFGAGSPFVLNTHVRN
uniref:Uncharacterized protein n=2 Tax=Anguilla anguilla TaxID=7936 RepID=A0A0E9VN36_ANGAN